MTLPVLEKAFSGPFAMYEALADYYQEQGYFTNSPARAYRYQILLEFAAMKDPANREIYRELLTYDMYLRENLKSRRTGDSPVSMNKKSQCPIISTGHACVKNRSLAPFRPS